MNKILLIITSFFIIVNNDIIYGQDLDFLTGLGSINDDRITNLVPGADGNLYLLGQTSDPIQYIDYNDQQITINPILPINYFVSCLNSSGKVVWTYLVGVSVIERVNTRIAIGDNGKVYFLIGTDDYIKTNSDSIPANGLFHQEMFEITNAGSIVSHKPFLDIVGRGDVTTIKTDSLYNLYTTGTFQNEMHLYNSSGVLSDTLLPESPSGKSAFIIKYNSSSQIIYNLQVANIINDFGIGTQSKLYMLCEVNYGTHLIVGNLDLVPFNQLRQQYLVEFNSNGSYLRHKEIGNTNGYEFRFGKIFSNPDGYELFGGFNQNFVLDTMHINTSLPLNMQNSTYNEALLVRLKYNNLDYKIYNTFKEYNENEIFYQPDSRNGYNYLLNTKFDTLSYDSVNHSYQLDGNMFLIAYSPTFNKMWGIKFGTKYNDYPQGLILDHNNIATVYGIFKDTLMILDSSAYRTNNAIVSNGGDDIFVVKSAFSVPTQNQEFFVQREKIVYPNPFTNQINVLTGKKAIVIELYDVNGKSIKKVYNTNQINSLDINPGIYFVKIILPENSFVFKMVKI